MTREEAKRTLEYISLASKHHVTIAVNSRDRQALDMAIKALEQPERKKDIVTLDKQKILDAGYNGKEVEFYIGGRLFAVREKAQ